MLPLVTKMFLLHAPFLSMIILSMFFHQTILHMNQRLSFSIPPIKINILFLCFIFIFLPDLIIKCIRCHRSKICKNKIFYLSLCSTFILYLHMPFMCFLFMPFKKKKENSPHTTIYKQNVQEQA
jgi:hypothetical protein